MKKYDFNKVIDRHHTDAMKIENMQEMWGRTDLMPLWIADMDFATPDFIIETICKRCESPILGYTCRPKEWATAIVEWQRMRYDWDVHADWLNFVPGIVPGIAFAIQCFTQPGDRILVTTPVYHPYLLVPRKNGRVVVECSLQLKDEEIMIDWDEMERLAVGCKMFLLCHPHNPGGRVWTREELCRIADICRRNNILVVSDEIHADLTLPPYQHLPYAESCREAEQNSITFASPSKAFNMAGMVSSYSIIPNDDIRQRFNDYMANNELNMGHAFAYQTVVSAYTHGTQWLDECIEYIKGNVEYVATRLAAEMPRITMIRPQASYLIFLDCRGLNMNHEELNNFFISHAHLALNDGEMFGASGAGFMRLNIAVPRTVLTQAMDHLLQAYESIDN